MAEQVLDKIRDVAEGQIDFEGQKRAELIVNYGLTAVGIISFVVGYVLQDITLALYLALGGTGLLSLVVIPPWPLFNQHPLKWLPVGGGLHASAPRNLVIDEKSIR